MKPTRMMIQLADCSIKFPLGIVENMHVRVGRFTIPMDYVIMDIKEYIVFPLILGRSFIIPPISSLVLQKANHFTSG